MKRCWWCGDPIRREPAYLECRFKSRGRMVTREVPVHERCVGPMVDRYSPPPPKVKP